MTEITFHLTWVRAMLAIALGLAALGVYGFSFGSAMWRYEYYLNQSVIEAPLRADIDQLKRDTVTREAFDQHLKAQEGLNKNLVEQVKEIKQTDLRRYLELASRQDDIYNALMRAAGKDDLRRRRHSDPCTVTSDC